MKSKNIENWKLDSIKRKIGNVTEVLNGGDLKIEAVIDMISEENGISDSSKKKIVGLLRLAQLRIYFTKDMVQAIDGLLGD